MSLFAELFNEMLMRDSAFLIYRALANIPEKPPKEKKKEKEEEKKEKEEEKKENGDKEEGEGEKGEEEKEKEERRKREEERKKRREEEEEEEKKEMVTKDSDLLLGCSYFDLSHCGYFETKVGLNWLVRSSFEFQIRDPVPFWALGSGIRDRYFISAVPD